MPKSDIGLIGLAVMGANLARNIANHGFKVSVFNRTTSKTDEFINEFGSDKLVGFESLQGFIESLSTPRKIIVMVKAGAPVDAVIESLQTLLDKDDIIIDCGNSQFQDTNRRYHALKEQGLNYFGCGVSGGEEGALNGPSLMPGGDFDCWKLLEPVFSSIAAIDFDGNPCVTYLSKGGAGNYVKMVHNGIEYALMQNIAEGYDFLKRGLELSDDKIASVFSNWSKGPLKSFLMDITVPVLAKKDADGNPLIDKILDVTGQKGTGKWTAIESLQQGMPLDTISAAVYARCSSALKTNRKELSQRYSYSRKIENEDLETTLNHLENAVYFANIIAYVQGFDLIKATSIEQKWDFDMGEICRIWQGGCIIRAELLRVLRNAFSENKDTLFAASVIQNLIKELVPSVRLMVSKAVLAGLPVPVLSSALTAFDSITSDRLPANLLQGLRDYFGAHTYQRTDKEGTFHTNW
jgi:6-phosphogluconate dehydrogenase